MKKNIILKGFHRPLQLIPSCFKPFGFIITDKVYSIHRRVKFASSCAYNLQNEDQDDWNKLFGVCFGISGIHKNSLRFGWRRSIKKQKIELCVIEYNNGKVLRAWIYGMDTDLDTEIDLEVRFRMTSYGVVEYNFLCNGEVCRSWHLDSVSSLMYFGCGVYFGGNRKAPHKMIINVENI